MGGGGRSGTRPHDSSEWVDGEPPRVPDVVGLPVTPEVLPVGVQPFRLPGTPLTRHSSAPTNFGSVRGGLPSSSGRMDVGGPTFPETLRISPLRGTVRLLYLLFFTGKHVTYVERIKVS